MTPNICLQCQRLTNDTYNRLVCDSCGHYKCRSCLLADDIQCYACFRNEGDSSPDKINESSSKIIEQKPLITVISNNVIYSENHMQESTHRYPSVFYSQNIQHNDLKASSNEPHTFNGSDSQYCDNAIMSNSNIDSIPKPDGCSDDKISRLDHNPSIQQDTDAKTEKFSVNVQPMARDGKRKKIRRRNDGALNNSKKEMSKDTNTISNDSVDTFSCDICNETFHLRLILDKHMASHKKSKFVICAYCNTSFDRKSKLIRHFSVHIDRKIHECLKCNKKFSDMQSLKNHSRIHSGIKPYTCNDCGKQYRDSSNLRRHKALHTGIFKKYACPQCDKKYKKMFSLNVHLKSHSRDKEMSLSCAFCPSIFYNECGKRRHELAHTSTKTFKCKLCKAIFKRRDNFIRHLRNAHPEGPYDDSMCVVENSNTNNIINLVEDTGKNKSLDETDYLLHIGENCQHPQNQDADYKIDNSPKILFDYISKDDTVTISHPHTESPSRLKILEANTNRESVIFKPVLNIKPDIYVHNTIKNNSDPESSINCLGFEGKFTELHTKKYDFIDSDSNTPQINDNVVDTIYASEQQKQLSTYYKRFSEETQYIHKKVNYDYKKETRNSPPCSPSQIPREYTDFDDAKASWCMHQFSSKNNQLEEASYSKNQYTPESIELYKKILFPGYTSYNIKNNEFKTDSRSNGNTDGMDEKKMHYSTDESVQSPNTISVDDIALSNEKKLSESHFTSPHKFENHWKRKITKKSERQLNLH